MPNNRPRPFVLCILDGWGVREDSAYNAIAMANTPNWARLLKDFPHTTVSTSGKDVGLPVDQMGNSEVGHMNIGSGRIVMQDLPRIDYDIETGALKDNPVLANFLEKLKNRNSTCHIMGLCSSGGVHGHISHITELSRIAAKSGVNIVIHAILDGRDTPPSSSLDFITDLSLAIKPYSNIKIGTISGRYFPMDRDNRWDLIELAYNAIVDANGERAVSAISAIERAYKISKTDEFIPPTVIGNYSGIKDNDGFIMMNFRADRSRQILNALILPDFDNFRRERKPKFSGCLGMVHYSDVLAPYIETLFPPQKIDWSLGEVMAGENLKQLRIAETEKYAHVTFFFNGGREEPYLNEERILIPSPRIATYDKQPQMSAYEVTESLVAAIDSGKYDFIVANYANADMVGHTGDLSATIRAIETVDHALGEVTKAIMRSHGMMIVTSDHGNAEMMMDPRTLNPFTAHTLNPVPLVLIADKTMLPSNISLECGRLCDIAPTILELMHIDKPAQMTGRSLIR